MLLRKNNLLKYILLFFIGGFAYGCIEILYRGYSHISMLVAGGICFILIGLINEVFSNNISFVIQMLVSAIIITTVEFITGYIVNIQMGVNVWDYSGQPFNLKGQICIFYTVYWFFLSPLAILLDDYLRYYIFGEEKPYYKLL